MVVLRIAFTVSPETTGVPVQYTYPDEVAAIEVSAFKRLQLEPRLEKAVLVFVLRVFSVSDDAV